MFILICDSIQFYATANAKHGGYWIKCYFKRIQKGTLLHCWFWKEMTFCRGADLKNFMTEFRFKIIRDSGSNVYRCNVNSLVCRMTLASERAVFAYDFIYVGWIDKFGTAANLFFNRTANSKFPYDYLKFAGDTRWFMLFA